MTSYIRILMVFIMMAATSGCGEGMKKNTVLSAQELKERNDEFKRSYVNEFLATDRVFPIVEEETFSHVRAAQMRLSTTNVYDLEITWQNGDRTVKSGSFERVYDSKMLTDFLFDEGNIATFEYPDTSCIRVHFTEGPLNSIRLYLCESPLH